MTEHLINGESAAPLERLPTIEIVWDADGQRAHLNFKVSDFRTWEFVIAVLDMAKRTAEQQYRMATLSAAQQAGADQAANEMIRRQLQRK